MHKPNYEGDDDALSEKVPYVEKSNINYSFISHDTNKGDQENIKNQKKIINKKSKIKNIINNETKKDNNNKDYKKYINNENKNKKNINNTSNENNSDNKNLISESDSNSNTNKDDEKKNRKEVDKNINNKDNDDIRESLKSREIDINDIHNSLFKSSKQPMKKQDEKPKEGDDDDENNISILKINSSLNTIKQSLNQNQEDNCDTSKFSDFDKNSDLIPEFVKNKEKGEPKLKKKKSEVISETSDKPKIKKNNYYDIDSELSSNFGKSFKLPPEFTKKKGKYDQDSDINSNLSDLISNFSSIDKKSETSIPPNPPKKKSKLNPIIIDKAKINENIENKNKKDDGDIIININKNKNKKDDDDIIININKDKEDDNDKIINTNKKKPSNNNNEIYYNLNRKPNSIVQSTDAPTSKPLQKPNKLNKPKEKNETYETNYRFGKLGEVFHKKFGYMNNIKINDILDNNLELLSLDEFSKKYRTFPKIYLESLKRHHLIHFTFLACNDNNNLFLKLSFFCISINFYFGLNTMLIFDSNMSDAYYDKEKAKAGYILMNLLLPFLICGLISFVIKLLVMPSYSIDRIIRKIQNNKKLKDIVLKRGIPIPRPNIIEIQSKEEEAKKHNISNNKKSELEKEAMLRSEFDEEKTILEKELGDFYNFYIKRVNIYFIASFILLALNWYFMTSYCAIFRNSGLKLIVNSIISVLSSFILPFILGLIPAGFGILAIKLKKNMIFKIYKKINILL